MKNSEQTKRRNERYNEYVKSITPLSSTLKSLFHAFLIGGTICILGQLIAETYHFFLPDLDLKMVASYTSSTLITLAIILTGLGWYDIIARAGGAGAFLPITGFANAMSSASMEFKTEGLIFGTSVKLFSVVGPVVVNGIVWSTIAGLVRLLWSVIF
ncbi:MAG: SpoVA/SpoVAEb family sporulation membrane protein [Clostridiales bacterium]|nr:SpoVA/SpoVAEb family sporulation membrane protein [Clostridiales bacterium]